MRLPLYGWGCRSDASIVLRTNLNYFGRYFVGEAIEGSDYFPNLLILNKSKPLKDFIDFHPSAPLVSERARDCLEPLIGPYCQFLPLVQFNQTRYFAVNVLVVKDCLDRVRSDILYSPCDPQKVLTISTHYFVDSMLPDCPIFKVESAGEVFVNQAIVDRVLECHLTNAVFRDPSRNPHAMIAHAEDINIVPGLAR